MNAQGSFFDSAADLAREVKTPRLGKVRASDPDTSHSAARSVRPTMANHAGKILEALSTADDGLTAERLWELTGGRAPHVAHTRAMGLASLGLVVFTDRKRVISTGREAHVWEITDAGRAVALELAREVAA